MRVGAACVGGLAVSFQGFLAENFVLQRKMIFPFQSPFSHIVYPVQNIFPAKPPHNRAYKTGQPCPAPTAAPGRCHLDTNKPFCGKCLRTKLTGQNSVFVAAGLVRASLKRRKRMSNPYDLRSPQVTVLQKADRGWRPEGRRAPVPV